MLDEVISAIEKPALNPGQTYAQGAETCLRFKAHLCPGCIVFPQTQVSFSKNLRSTKFVYFVYFDVKIILSPVSPILVYLVRNVRQAVEAHGEALVGGLGREGGDLHHLSVGDHLAVVLAQTIFIIR